MAGRVRRARNAVGNAYRQEVLRWLCASVIGVVISGFAFLLVTGRYVNDGAMVATVSSTHGVHEGDLFVLAGWALSMATLLALTTMAGRPRS